MKPRDRQASGGNVPQTALAGHSLKEASNGSANAHDVPASGPLLWEDWYRLASPDQQAQVLDLARRQGLLYAHQIPAHTNGCHRPESAPDPAEPRILMDILAGQTGKLTPLISAAVEVADVDLDPLQRQAVACALSTQDICLIQGPPGTGKSRVVQEILLQASLRGLRVLFLSQHAACVDGVLQQLTRQDGPSPIRLMCAGESVPASVQPMLLGQRMSNFSRQILEKADRSRLQAEEQCRERHGQTEIWHTLTKLVEQRGQAEERLKSVREELARVAGEVESQAAVIFGEVLDPLTKKKDADLALGKKSFEEADQETQKLQQEETRLITQLQELTELSKSGWWTLTWWKNRLGGAPAFSQTELQEKLTVLRADLARSQERRQAFDLHNQQIEQAFQAERNRLVQEEAARRQQSLTAQEAGHLAAVRQAEEQWQALTAPVHPEKLRPQAMTIDAVEQARQLWQGQKQIDEENCLLARQWLTFLQESGERLAARLPGLAGIVAGSVAAWNQEGGSIPGSFDLLILEEADLIAEAVLLQLARKARRWILVGNYLGQPPAPTPAPANPREVRPSSPRAGVFQKIWPLLHADPSQLPNTWGEENDRLVCQFRRLSPQELGRLERESLADAPDIELRILTMPRSEPVLAQVAFPLGTTVVRAKEFIFRELQEIPVQTCGRNGWLDEQTETFVWRLVPHPAHDSGGAAPVCLQTGLTEWVHGTHTTSLEFAKTHWHRQQVLDWLSRKFRHRDLGRTVFLQVPHRMESGLAAWVGDVFFPDTLLAHRSQRTENSEAKTAGPVSFIPVAAAAETQGRSRKPAHEAPCLEIDLANGRGSDKVPPDLLAGLARNGFVNYPEAQAVIRVLEGLHPAAAPGGFGVIAFHAGQVELIRRLLARSPALTGCPVTVGLPGQFLHGQCHVAVVSLTRSNFQRTGVFAAESADPVLAVTRARRRLILVGDPDTLKRWSQCQETAETVETGREKHWLRRLARYLRSEGLHQEMFQMCVDAPLPMTR